MWHTREKNKCIQRCGYETSLEFTMLKNLVVDGRIILKRLLKK
jgi:hypothetical protein